MAAGYGDRYGAAGTSPRTPFGCRSKLAVPVIPPAPGLAGSRQGTVVLMADRYVLEDEISRHRLGHQALLGRPSPSAEGAAFPAPPASPTVPGASRRDGADVVIAARPDVSECMVACYRSFRVNDVCLTASTSAQLAVQVSSPAIGCFAAKHAGWRGGNSTSITSFDNLGRNCRWPGLGGKYLRVGSGTQAPAIQLSVFSQCIGKNEAGRNRFELDAAGYANRNGRGCSRAIAKLSLVVVSPAIGVSISRDRAGMR